MLKNNVASRPTNKDEDEWNLMPYNLQCAATFSEITTAIKN